MGLHPEWPAGSYQEMQIAPITEQSELAVTPPISRHMGSLWFAVIFSSPEPSMTKALMLKVRSTRAI